MPAHMFFLLQSCVGSISSAIFDGPAQKVLSNSSLLDSIAAQNHRNPVRRCDAGSADDVRSWVIRGQNRDDPPRPLYDQYRKGRCDRRPPSPALAQIPIRLHCRLQSSLRPAGLTRGEAISGRPALDRSRLLCRASAPRNDPAANWGSRDGGARLFPGLIVDDPVPQQARVAVGIAGDAAGSV